MDIQNLCSEETIRYNRQIILPEITSQGQIKLKQARVLIAGVGGLALFQHITWLPPESVPSGLQTVTVLSLET